jgi:hypothetical protein
MDTDIHQKTIDKVDSQGRDVGHITRGHIELLYHIKCPCGYIHITSSEWILTHEFKCGVGNYLTISQQSDD